MATKLSGILPAIASPCDERDVFDEKTFATLAAKLYSQGAHGLYVCGATGDAYKMRLEERKRAVEIAIEISKKQQHGVVIVHVGTSNSRDAMALAEHAADTGAQAVSSMRPANCTHEQLVSYYTDIAHVAGLPLLVYHIPMLTGAASTVDEMLELLDIEGVVGLKSSDWNLFFVRRLLDARPDITVFNGMDEFLCPGLLYGCSGGIGMNYNLFPGLFLGIYQAVQKGDIARAMELQNRFLAYADIIWRYNIVASFEVLMQELGHASHCWRRPRPVMDAQTAKRFMKEIRPKLEGIEQLQDLLEGASV